MSAHTSPTPAISVYDYERTTLQRDLDRLLNIGFGLSTIGKLLAACHILSGKDHCPDCDDYHRDLLNPAHLSGLYTVVDELGETVGSLAESNTELLHRITKRNS